MTRYEEICKTNENEYNEFENVKNKRSMRSDVHAFIILSELFPKQGGLIAAAMHEEIILDVSEDEIDSLSDEQILDLYRCGVRYDEYCLAMFI